MPPRLVGAPRARRPRRVAMERMIADRVAKAVADLERDQIAQANSEGSSKASGCSYKTFMSGKPHPFNGTEGVVGLTRWIEKNGNLKTLGSENANKIPWDEFKTMLTTEYCPDTEVHKMEIELWNLTLKGDDVDSYTNRFHKLILMANDGGKRKWDDNHRCNQGNNNSKHKINNQTPSNKRHEPTKVYAAALQNPTVVAGTFILNDHYASVLFDSGAERSFVSLEYTPCIHVAPVRLGISYEVELADGKIVNTNTVLQGCTLELLNHEFKIDLLPTRLGSFDVIVGMDWLACYHAVIICDERIVRIPLLDNHILDIYGERLNDYLNSLSCVKAVEKKPADIRVACEFPEVFPDDLSGFPPIREVEFCIDLIPGALPIAKIPYRLAPSEMSELSNQLRELQEKGFIR
nr:putative reverse transcriptase domain-containing protein [Tanacetum cinerariifolium]